MMKCRFIMLVAIIIIIGANSIVMAASNSLYADVPTNHWAYGAVKQLSQTGIISGEAGKFNGDRVVTRYELASIVANAMTKYDKADAQSKALIDKLRVEFTEELKALNVRMDAVEAKLSNVPKFYGDVYQYYGYTHTQGKQISHNLYQDIRWGMLGNIGDEWKYQLKFLMVANDKPNIQYTDTSQPDAGLFLANIQNSNFYGGSLYIGKYWMGATSNLENWVYVDSVRGIGYKKKVGAVTLGFNYGLLDYQPYGSSTTGYPLMTRVSVDTKIGNALVGAAYWDLQRWKKYGTTEIFSKLTEIQFKKPISKDFTVQSDWGKSDAKTANKFYALRLFYKQVNLQKIGTYNLEADYHYFGHNALIDPTWAPVDLWQSTTGVGLKGFGVSYTVVPFKSVIWRNTLYPNNKPVTGTSVNTTTFRSVLDFIF